MFSSGNLRPTANVYFVCVFVDGMILCTDWNQQFRQFGNGSSQSNRTLDRFYL